MLKLLQRNISYRFLHLRVTDLWKLTRGIEMLDVEGGFYMVRFHIQEDYLRILEGGPWIVIGYYL